MRVCVGNRAQYSASGMVFLAVAIGVFCHWVLGATTVDIDLGELLKGLQWRHQSVSSGRVSYDVFITVYPDRQLAEPGASEEEVKRRAASMVERERKFNTEKFGAEYSMSTARRAEIWREAEEQVRSMLRKDEVHKRAGFTWSGSKFHSEIWEDIRDELYRVPHEKVAFSSLKYNGKRAAYYANDVVTSAVSGTVRREALQAGEISRTPPMQWSNIWSASGATEKFEDFSLEGVEFHDGHKAYWVCRKSTGEEALVCPGLGFLVLEMRSRRDDGSLARTWKVQQMEKKGEVYLVTSVLRESYRPDGTVHITMRFEVAEAELNIPIDEKEFEPDFPPGTQVTDFTFDPPLEFTVPGPNVPLVAEEELSLDDIFGSTQQVEPSAHDTQLEMPASQQRQPARAAQEGTHVGTVAGPFAHWRWMLAVGIGAFFVIGVYIVLTVVRRRRST